MWVVSYEAGRKKKQLPDECSVSSFCGSLGHMFFVPDIGKLAYDGDIIAELKFWKL